MIFYSKKKYTNKFHAFTMEIDSRNMSESKEFRWENDSKLAQDVHFFIFFFLEKPLSLEKNDKLYFIFYYKNRNTSQFLVFMIKNDFKNVSESGEFRFENSLKTYIFNFMLELQ